jgi:hypothetical protein
MTMPSNNRPIASRDELLLYSVAEFYDLLKPLLDALPANGLCEVGVEAGRFARAFGGYCLENDLPYTGIDPSLNDVFVQEHATGKIRFIQEESLEALPRIASGFNVFVLDGDHNYYTVYHELEAIYGHGRRDALTILHDVGWPWARRDQYCAPERIPEAFRHPHRDDRGVMPESGGLVEQKGFIGQESNYHYHAAEREGGPGNGVLTAVEDVVARHQHLTSLTIPGIFGLALVWSPEGVPPAFRSRMTDLERALTLCGSLLRSLETNRLNLLMDHLSKHRSFGQLQKEYDALHVQYQDILTKFMDLLEKWNKLYAAYQDLENPGV